VFCHSILLKLYCFLFHIYFPLSPRFNPGSAAVGVTTFVSLSYSRGHVSGLSEQYQKCVNDVLKRLIHCVIILCFHVIV